LNYLLVVKEAVVIVSTEVVRN